MIATLLASHEATPATHAVTVLVIVIVVTGLALGVWRRHG